MSLAGKMHRACLTALAGFRNRANAGKPTAGSILLPTQEQMILIMEIAHHTKALMALGVQAVNKLGDPFGSGFFCISLMFGLLPPVTRARDPDTTQAGTPGALGYSQYKGDDVCAACNAPVVEGGCRWSRAPEQKHRLWHVKCLIPRGLEHAAVCNQAVEEKMAGDCT
jgi:hypothetical protein